MDSSVSSQPCFFLERLPVELRREIHTYLLTFSSPLKLRQVIPGSRDLAILRTSRQIHDEALAVLYELNTIMVTRNGKKSSSATCCPFFPCKFAIIQNIIASRKGKKRRQHCLNQSINQPKLIATSSVQDFCPHTTPSLKTPLRHDQARHLLIAGFSVSIACTLRGRGNRCAVCQPHAAGLFDALRAMPKLRATRLDFTRHEAEMLALMEANAEVVGFLDVEADAGAGEDDYIGRKTVGLSGNAVRGLNATALVDKDFAPTEVF